MRLICFILMILLILSCVQSKRKTSKGNYKFEFKPVSDSEPNQKSTTSSAQKLVEENIQKPKYSTRTKTKLLQQIRQSNQQRSEQNEKNQKKVKNKNKKQTQQNENQSLTKLNEPNQCPRNQTFVQCVARVSGVSAALGAAGSFTTGIFGSSAALSAAGFTTSGISSGSIAAAAHSTIGIVKGKSIFAALQSAGALGTGIFGAAFWPITLAAGTAGGTAYILSQCSSTLQ